MWKWKYAVQRLAYFLKHNDAIIGIVALLLVFVLHHGLEYENLVEN